MDLRTMVIAPKSSHTHTHPQISALAQDYERIKYKLLSLTCKVLTTSQPDYLHNLIAVQ